MGPPLWWLAAAAAAAEAAAAAAAAAAALVRFHFSLFFSTLFLPSKTLIKYKYYNQVNRKT